MVSVSIIIPTFNRKSDLINCLDSILKQTYRDYEILVIDNGSTDGTLEYLKNKKNIKIIKNLTNLGASAARNQAIVKSNGEFLWFLDSDAEVKDKNCLYNMIKILKENSDIGQIGGEMVLFDKNYKIRVSNSNRNQDGVFIYTYSAKMREVDYVATSNCFMKKSLLFKVGGFDPYYFYGYEDNDLGFQVRKIGYKNIIDDRILAYHHVDKKTRLSNFFRFHRNSVRLLIKKENLFFLLFLPIIDFYTTLKLLPKRVEELKKRDLNDIAWLNKKNSKDDNGIILKVVKLGFNYSYGLFLGYVYNIISLPQTLYIRMSKKKFI